MKYEPFSNFSPISRKEVQLLRREYNLPYFFFQILYDVIFLEIIVNYIILFWILKGGRQLPSEFSR